MKTQIDQKNLILKDIQAGKFDAAAAKIEQFKKSKKYLKKDRVLYYLDKGAILHFQGKYEQSNQLFEKAEIAMEDLFTRSISRAAASMLLNDNILAYTGEVYENLYVNVFKAMNYINLGNFEDAYVEIKRINDKLKLMEVKYGEWVDKLNKNDSIQVEIEKKPIRFYDDALAHYLSYIIFRADGEYDNSRISFQKIKKSWRSYHEVYDHPLPSSLSREPEFRGSFLNVMAFTGNAPIKKPIGGEITTYDSLIHISDLSGYRTNLWIPFPGIKAGYHFKFAFPALETQQSYVDIIDVYVDDKRIGSLDLLEDMGRVAEYTFESKKHIIYFKTLLRTILKGLGSIEAKEKLRKKAEAEDNWLLKSLINWSVDAVVDATENPDLRCWCTMPRYCYIGEFNIPPGEYHIEIRFINQQGYVEAFQEFEDFRVTNGLNLIEAVCLN